MGSRSEKNGNFSSILVLDVIVDGDDEHEHKEDTSPAQEMPDVMPGKKIKV